MALSPRVAAVRFEVRTGRYRIDPAAVAEAMLEWVDREAVNNVSPIGARAMADNAYIARAARSERAAA